MSEKLCKDMDFQEFHDWASGYILLEIGRGNTLRNAVYMVLTQTL